MSLYPERQYSENREMHKVLTEVVNISMLGLPEMCSTGARVS